MEETIADWILSLKIGDSVIVESEKDPPRKETVVSFYQTGLMVTKNYRLFDYGTGESINTTINPMRIKPFKEELDEWKEEGQEEVPEDSIE